MKKHRTERRDRKVENEPAVRRPVTQEAETERKARVDGRTDEATTRRGSSSERSDR